MDHDILKRHTTAQLTTHTYKHWLPVHSYVVLAVGASSSVSKYATIIYNTLMLILIHSNSNSNSNSSNSNCNR